MRAHTLPIALAAAFVLSACASAAAGSGSPFRRETGMPDEPPLVSLAYAGARVVGTRYTSDWVTRRRTVVQSPAAPVPWPSDIVPLNGGDDHVSVVFATHIEPDHVVVHTYPAVDERGEPTVQASSTFECDATTSCHLHHVGSETLVDVPVVADARYLVVFATWHVPLDDLVDGGPANASASWIFTVRNR